MANAIEADSTTGRENITSTGTGNNALTGGITVTGAGNIGTTFMSVFNNQSSGNLTISGGITAAGGFTGGFALRGTLAGNTGFVNGAVNTPGSSTYLGINGATTWTLNTAGSNYAIFSLVGTGSARLGVNNAIATSAYVWWTTNSTTGALDLNGFNQSVAGLDANYAANGNNTITNNGASDSILTLAGLSANRTFAGVIKDGPTNKVSLVMNSEGRQQTLSGVNTYTGTTSINAGTVLINNASALGNGGNITFGGGALQYGTVTTDFSSRLKNSASAILIDTNNNNVTFASAIDSSNVGGLTKNGTGTLTLNGTNTYTGATVVNTGTLAAAHASALGGNTTVQVNGGSLLVTADDAINGKNITLASTATGGASAASLAFSGTYNGSVGALTLSQDSIIDLGTGSVFVHFSELAMGLSHTLAIYNWTGTTLWGGGDGNNTDQFYIDRTLTTSELNRISFYSGIDNSSFVGTAYQLSGGSFNQEIIPVPEPGAWATAMLLLFAAACGARQIQGGKKIDLAKKNIDTARALT